MPRRSTKVCVSVCLCVCDTVCVCVWRGQEWCVCGVDLRKDESIFVSLAMWFSPMVGYIH